MIYLRCDKFRIFSNNLNHLKSKYLSTDQINSQLYCSGTKIGIWYDQPKNIEQSLLLLEGC